MYKVHPKSKYKKDRVRLKSQHKNLAELDKLINCLRMKDFSRAYKNHKLEPKSQDIWECHIGSATSDWVLVYQYEEDKLILHLIRTGSHSEVLKNTLTESKEDRQKLIDKFGSELANDFFRIRHNIHDSKKKDLYYWLDKSSNELKQYIEKIEKTLGVVYSDNNWKVYKITSPEMLNDIIGRHKIWCVQNRHSDNGLDWTFHAEKNGTKYYLYVNKNTNKKYLRGINKDDFMEDGVWGEDNRQIRDKEFIKSLPSVE